MVRTIMLAGLILFSGAVLAQTNDAEPACDTEHALETNYEMIKLYVNMLGISNQPDQMARYRESVEKNGGCSMAAFLLYEQDMAAEEIND